MEIDSWHGWRAGWLSSCKLPIWAAAEVRQGHNAPRRMASTGDERGERPVRRCRLSFGGSGETPSELSFITFSFPKWLPVKLAKMRWWWKE